MRRLFSAALPLTLVMGLIGPATAQVPGPAELPVDTATIDAQTPDDPSSPADTPVRRVEPVVLTGKQLPGWSGPQAEGVAEPYPSGSSDDNPLGDEKRDAHNGRLIVPPAEAQTGVDPDSVVAFRWTGDRFKEIPVQVDERFPYFLANGRSNFGFYSGTDKEISYEWDVESWKKTAGECLARYPSGVEATQDPVLTLDDDDEIVFMASDAGPQAPLETLGPAGTGELKQEVALLDPRDPAKQRFVYLFTREGGSKFTAANGYVDYQRDENADEWIDRYTFAENDPEKLGTSNTGYGPNLEGTVCTDDKRTEAIETGPRMSDDRFVRDGVTVSTDSYQWYASGRWMVREMHVTKPGTVREYGADLIDRWKGRAFQQSPDSSISVVGFEDEQVNWEGNSALLGELAGPVRAIRETWGADSGTNVTKTETFYRDVITYRYRVRVHPIPPDGLYTSWDYNHDVASTYFNETKMNGVAIDGQNDDIGQVDEAPNGQPAFFDAPDPTFTKPLAFLNWEQVSGKNDSGSLVYMFEMKNAQSLLNPAVVPYYRDDACLDDGTGDNPTPRPWPGEAHSDDRLTDYRQWPCYGDPALSNENNTYAWEAPEGKGFRQGCFGCHGIHYFATHDTDNAFGPVDTTEIDGQQWQWAVPTEAPRSVGDAYANTVKTPLVAIASLQQNTAGGGDPDPQEPAQTRLEVVGDTAGQTTDSAILSARLSDDDGPIAGAEVAFTLNGAAAGTAVTDSDGVASVSVELSGPARETYQEAFFSGTDDYAASSSATTFHVMHEDSTLDLALRRNGPTTDATATLTDLDSGVPVEGRTVTFYVNGEPVGEAMTDASGMAVYAFHANQAKPGDTITAIFGGDDTFLPSSAEGSVPRNDGAPEEA